MATNADQRKWRQILTSVVSREGGGKGEEGEGWDLPWDNLLVHAVAAILGQVRGGRDGKGSDAGQSIWLAGWFLFM